MRYSIDIKMPKSALTNAEKADAYARECKFLRRREHKLIYTLCSAEIFHGMRSKVLQNIKLRDTRAKSNYRSDKFYYPTVVRVVKKRIQKNFAQTKHIYIALT